jgi:thioesterase domain-containing protein
MQLMARIRKSFGQTLPFAVLLRGATIEHLAAALQGGASDEPAAALVPLQPHGDRPPFVCVHPSGGNVLCYVELARRLGDGWPFFGVSTPGIDSGAELLGSIEEMAASYLRELLARQPEGPYLLGGWSMGGVVAFEMARQLAGLGKRVDLVALIDAAAPATWTPEIAQDDYLDAWFARDLAGLSGRGNELSLEELRAQPPERRLEVIREVAQEAGTEDVLRLLQVFKTNFRAMVSYSPQPYDGRVVLFRAACGLGAGMADPSLGWSGLARGVFTLHEVPGDHYSLVRAPDVDELAARLRQSLEEEPTR